MGEFFVGDMVFLEGFTDLFTSIFAWAMFVFITMFASPVIDLFSSKIIHGFSLIAVTFKIDMFVNHFCN